MHTTKKKKEKEINSKQRSHHGDEIIAPTML
jgi:hypothetical protein